MCWPINKDPTPDSTQQSPRLALCDDVRKSDWGNRSMYSTNDRFLLIGFLCLSSAASEEVQYRRMLVIDRHCWVIVGSIDFSLGHHIRRKDNRQIVAKCLCTRTDMQRAIFFRWGQFYGIIHLVAMQTKRRSIRLTLERSEQTFFGKYASSFTPQRSQSRTRFGKQQQHMSPTGMSSFGSTSFGFNGWVRYETIRPTTRTVPTAIGVYHM